MKYLAPILIFLGLMSVSLLSEENTEASQTNIYSKYLEMISGDNESTFHFSGDVQVVGADLNLKSQKLTVVSVKEGDANALIGQFGRIKSIIAEESVFVSQAGRTASGERAEFFPEEGRVLLTGGNPTVTDAQGTVSAGDGGYIEWFQGQRRARVVPAERITVTIGGLKMKMHKDEEAPSDESSTDVDEADTDASETTQEPSSAE